MGASKQASPVRVTAKVFAETVQRLYDEVFMGPPSGVGIDRDALRVAHKDCVAAYDALAVAWAEKDEALEALELERRRDETKATDVAAVNELFRLLSLPASQKAENHQELVVAANNACGAARIIMLEAWEGEDEPWQR